MKYFFYFLAIVAVVAAGGFAIAAFATESNGLARGAAEQVAFQRMIAIGCLASAPVWLAVGRVIDVLEEISYQLSLRVR